MIMGMQTVWVFGDTADILKLPKPQVEGYLSYGGGEYSLIELGVEYANAFARCIWQCDTSSRDGSLGREILEVPMVT